MSERQLIENIDRYHSGEMSADELEKFEALRRADAAIDAKVVEHQVFSGLLKQYSERVELENRLNTIHQEIDVHNLKESLMAHPSWVVRLWRNHHSKISVAASVAIFTAITLLWVSGKFENRNNIEALSRKVDQLGRSNANLSKSIRDIKAPRVPIDRYSSTGTGFALTSDGLIATNFHVVRDADSVYVQDALGKSFKAKVISQDPLHDIAILKIADESFDGLGTIPYSFKRSESPMAERLFTYGYPEGSAVYRMGYLASKTGLRGDSVHYQIDIPISPGNSGSPLWDSRGNVVGITDAKQLQSEGAHYAIKSRYLLDAIDNIPADSLDKKINLNKKSTLIGLSDVDKVEKAKNFVFMVKIYN